MYNPFMSRRQSTTDVFAVIADPTRRAMLHRLCEGEHSVTSLAAQFDVTLSAISQHIRILREVGLVTVRKAGRERVYRLNAEPLQPIAAWVNFYAPFWSDKLNALGAYLDETAANDAPPLLREQSGTEGKEKTV